MFHFPDLFWASVGYFSLLLILPLKYPVTSVHIRMVPHRLPTISSCWVTCVCRGLTNACLALCIFGSGGREVIPSIAEVTVSVDLGDAIDQRHQDHHQCLLEVSFGNLSCCTKPDTLIWGPHNLWFSKPCRWFWFLLKFANTAVGNAKNVRGSLWVRPSALLLETQCWQWVWEEEVVVLLPDQPHQPPGLLDTKPGPCHFPRPRSEHLHASKALSPKAEHELFCFTPPSSGWKHLTKE